MSLTDYSSLEGEIKNAPDPEILPKDTEVKARIIAVNHGVIEKESSKSYGAGYYSVLFDVPSEPLCPVFSAFFYDLADRDKIEVSQFTKALPTFRAFAESFNIDYSRPFSWEDDLPGLEGWIVLGVQKDKNGEYPDKNIVKKYISHK